MKKIYTILLAMTSVMMINAVEPAEFDATIVLGKGSPYIQLMDNCEPNTEYYTRRYVVRALSSTSEPIAVLDTIDESSSKGGRVTAYTIKDSTICKLYAQGSASIQLMVSLSTQDAKGAEFSADKYVGVNEYVLPTVYSVSGYTMMSDSEKGTVSYYSVFDKKTGAYVRYYADSATLCVKVCAAEAVAAQWQKSETLTAGSDQWVNVGEGIQISAADANMGKEQKIDMDLQGEGGFRNQYWRLAMTVADTTIYSNECDVFPEYPTILVGPIATSGSGNKNVERGETDTIWGFYEAKITFTGSKNEPCYNLPQADVVCASEVLGSGLTQLTQPGKKMTVTANERQSVTLKFYDEDKATLLETKTCNCGSSATPAVPEKEGYVFTEWVWMWASAYTWTMAQLQAESFTVDMNFFAQYEENTGLAEIMAEMPVGTKAFNILGQPVGEDYRGIVVVGGRKFLVH